MAFGDGFVLIHDTYYEGTKMPVGAYLESVDHTNMRRPPLRNS